MVKNYGYSCLNFLLFKDIYMGHSLKTGPDEVKIKTRKNLNYHYISDVMCFEK